MRTLAVVLIAVAATLLAGCATIIVDSSRTEPQARAARPAGHPIELLTEQVPARPHKVIGSVRARVKLSESGSKVAPPQKVIARLQDEARALGGDALLPITVNPASGGGTYVAPPGTVLAGESEIWAALVIVWLEPGTAHRPQPHARRSPAR
ncbi:MAG: hypothetical protein AB2L07_03985 [Thermoanaerobaculaceae bacterium]